MGVCVRGFRRGLRSSLAVSLHPSRDNEVEGVRLALMLSCEMHTVHFTCWLCAWFNVVMHLASLGGVAAQFSFKFESLRGYAWLYAAACFQCESPSDECNINSLVSLVLVSAHNL